MMAIKISLGLFFLRIMTRRWQRYIVYAVMIASTIVAIGSFFFTTFQCGVPKADEFIRKQLSGKCQTKQQIFALTYSQSVVNLATDVILAAMSVSMLTKSKLGRREKATVSFILILAAGYVLFAGNSDYG
jgi:hypothetical protein